MKIEFNKKKVIKIITMVSTVVMIFLFTLYLLPYQYKNYRYFVTIVASVTFFVFKDTKNKGKFKKGIEYGSARWADPHEIKPFINEENARDNIILTKTERLTMVKKPKSIQAERNKHVLVLGGSGSGKTRFFIKPNLMQRYSSYVITDPKGLTS